MEWKIILRISSYWENLYIYPSKQCSIVLGNDFFPFYACYYRMITDNFPESFDCVKICEAVQLIVAIEDSEFKIYI